MQKTNQQEEIIKKRRVRGLGRVFDFLVSNWVVIIILILFASQIYLIWEVREIKKANKYSDVSVASQISEVDINQIKSMISSMYGRIGTMQGDLNYLKTRR